MEIYILNWGESVIPGSSLTFSVYVEGGDLPRSQSNNNGDEKRSGFK